MTEKHIPVFFGEYPLVGFTSIGQTLYSLDKCGNVFRTTDYGATWQRRELTSTRRFAKPGDEEAVWVPM